MEVLVAAGIMAVIGTSLVRVLYQMQTLSSRGNAELALNGDLRTSLQWLGRDFQMAQTTTLVDGGPAVSCASVSPNPCITLGWTDHYNGGSTAHTSTYALVGTKFQRTHDGSTLTIATNMPSAQVSRQGRLVTLAVTVTSPTWVDITKGFTHYFYLRQF